MSIPQIYGEWWGEVQGDNSYFALLYVDKVMAGEIGDDKE